MSKSALLALLVVGSMGGQAWGISGGQRAEQPPPDEAVVFVSSNGRQGRIEGVRSPTNGFYIFRGIRYALAATGSRRFQRAKLRPVEGDEFATLPCQPCPQPDPRDSARILGDEDCLCLNIYTPRMPDDSQGLPVLFWIHGGGFRTGSAAYYGGKYLNERNMILVSIQYRLGTLGFLSFGNSQMPGNAALFDMTTALQWVERYISWFGGDPSKIYTFGQGSGGGAAMLMALSSGAPRPAGVLALSGTALSPFVLDEEPAASAALVARANGCPAAPVAGMVACLRNLPLERLVQSDSVVETNHLKSGGFVSGVSGKLGTAAVVDGRRDGRSLPTLLEDKPEDRIKSKDFRPVPLLTGVTKDEAANAILDTFNDEIVKKLADSDFISTELLKKLSNLIPIHAIATLKDLATALVSETENLTRKAVSPLNIENYYGHIDDISGALVKVIEATGDALFNLPAFLATNLWSGRAQAYLYSFDHVGKKKKGKHFLPGQYLVGADDEEAGEGVCAHGDELAYLFEPLDLDGNSVEEPANSSTIADDDDRVRDIFTDIISQFVHKGSMTLAGGDFPTFAGDNAYVSISAKPKIEKGFRFCQMGLWANIPDRLSSPLCTILAQIEIGLSPISNEINKLANSSLANIIPSSKYVKIPGFT